MITFRYAWRDIAILSKGKIDFLCLALVKLFIYPHKSRLIDISLFSTCQQEKRKRL